MKSILLTLVLVASIGFSSFAQQNRWNLVASDAISWKIAKNEPHQDHVEMSGKYVSTVVRYGVNADESLFLTRTIVWPMLRTVPNNTHASLMHAFNDDLIRSVQINGKNITSEKVEEFQLFGKLTIKSSIAPNVDLVRELFPSTDKPAFCEKYTLVNKGATKLSVNIPPIDTAFTTPPQKGVEGSYTLRTSVQKGGSYTLSPNQNLIFYRVFEGAKQATRPPSLDIEKELKKRTMLVDTFTNNLVLETPDNVLNRAFSFAKIRAAESIFQTKGGPMHGPGGLSYYAAIWANDQAEYINPFFPYLGYAYGIESALNAYRHFAKFMNADYRPIPSSVIAEGLDIWNGAGDRGDAAMIAYGAARFALSQGDRKIANELWPLIEWCLEYNRRNLNDSGVVSSDSDELEGRLPAGKANLNTSSLYYDALVSASMLGKSLGVDSKQLTTYRKQATELKTKIEKYFGAEVMGYPTYRYYAGNDILRAWISTPLTVDIFDRKEGTINALFSPKLWTIDGLASQAGDSVFWDRSTLYALRGVFAAGEKERGLKYLKLYSSRRLLGDHVPYPVEAYPEGDQRHLSAESALYCRIYTEGLFGIRPTGLRSFVLQPQLPAEWTYMRLKNVYGFDHKFDIEVKKDKEQMRLKIITAGKTVVDKVIKEGDKCSVVLK